MPSPQKPFPKHLRRFTARTKWGRAFFYAQWDGGALFSSRACRRASRSFTPSVALSEPLFGVLSKHESGGVRWPRFQLQSKGEGRALHPGYAKSGGLFFKSPRLSCETRGLLCKTPPLFGGLSTAHGRKEPVGLSHSAKVKTAVGGLLAFPPPTKSTTPIKPRTRTTFFAKWGGGGGKKDFCPRFGYKMRRLIT